MNVRLDEETRREVEEAAAEDYRTVSDWVRLVILRALAERAKRKAEEKEATDDSRHH